MTAKSILAANWKMNFLSKDVDDYFKQFHAVIDAKASKERAVIFAVPYLWLEQTLKMAHERGYLVFAQNVHFAEKGAFTGEISCSMLKSLGVDGALIGHSERRQYFAETDESCAKKVMACLAAGLQPLLCVGETRAEREAGRTLAVVRSQLEVALAPVTEAKNLIIAYEPVWAIGTGLAATSADAQEVHADIKAFLMKRFGEKEGAAIPILYGGSASPKNFTELMQQKDIHGALVGGASLVPADFSKMYEILQI